MLDPQTAHQFAQEWISAWNAHDLERILSHYTEDFIMESPYAFKWLPETGGVVKGKPAVRAYWKMGLEAIPDLVFELHGFFVGVSGITLYYTNRATGKQTTEVLFLNDAGKAYRAYAFYN
jgi:ketosteroid isomerase-like protein